MLSGLKSNSTSVLMKLSSPPRLHLAACYEISISPLLEIFLFQFLTLYLDTSLFKLCERLPPNHAGLSMISLSQTTVLLIGNL
jgi:hypothetical protein